MMNDRPQGGAVQKVSAPSALLVDLDGTLVDSNYHHALAWWRAFRDAGHAIPIARLHKLIGMGGDQLLDEVLGRQDDALRDAHAKEFRAIRDEVAPLPGASDLLRAVHELGLTIVLATSSGPDDVRHMRDLLDADDCIDHEVNADDLESTKPAPDVFQVALERAGVGAANAVVLGDTGWDIDAATRCGLRCIGLTTGGWSRLDLESRGAVEVHDGPSALRERLEGSALGSHNG